MFTGILFDSLLSSKIRLGNHEYLSPRSDMQKKVIYCTIEILPGDINLRLKEDRMDVEPCSPLFSAELESAEALASS